MRAIDELDGQPTTRASLQLIAVTFVRPGELRHAEKNSIFQMLSGISQPKR